MLSTRAPRRLLLAAAGPIKMSDLVYLRAAASHGSQVAGLPLSGLKLDLNGGILQLFHAGQARMFSVIQ